MRSFESEQIEKGTEEIYSTTSGIREYALERGESTERLIEGAVVQASNAIVELAKEDIKEGATSEEILEKYAGRAVSEVTKQHMQSGLSIPRIVFGGNYKLEDVIDAASCIDAANFNKLVLEEGFGLECEIKKTRLGVVPNHHYVTIKKTRQVVDSVLGSKKNTGGFFETEEKFQRRLSIINNGGLDVLKKQIVRLISPEKKEPPAEENQERTPTKETVNAIT